MPKINREGKPAGGSRLLPLVTCPHCWETFAPENTLWISSDHPTLRDDPRVDGEPRRFPAERFHVSGDAIDARGTRCSAFACPACHLEVPRCAYEYPPFILSMVGGSGSGKSFLLPTMTWRLRSELPQGFGLEFLETDPRFNLKLHEYEKTLFFSADKNAPISLEKTQVQAMDSLYDAVLLGGETVWFPRPFLFRLRTTSDALTGTSGDEVGRTVYLYDNSGESYAPREGSYGGNYRATDHLGHSHATIFLFDPTQDMRFREVCRTRCADPQLRSAAHPAIQTTILLNATARMKQLRGLGERARHDSPLIVVLTKLDAWVDAFPDAAALRNCTPIISRPQGASSSGGSSVLSIAEVDRLSSTIRSLLLRLAPELVSAADGFSRNVTFLACSATGRNVESLSGSGESSVTAFGIRPQDIRPQWCELPFLMALARNNLLPDGSVSHIPLDFVTG